MQFKLLFFCDLYTTPSENRKGPFFYLSYPEKLISTVCKRKQRITSGPHGVTSSPEQPVFPNSDFYCPQKKKKTRNIGLLPARYARLLFFCHNITFPTRKKIIHLREGSRPSSHHVCFVSWIAYLGTQCSHMIWAFPLLVCIGHAAGFIVWVISLLSFLIYCLFAVLYFWTFFFAD